jgi:hypothetical protein
MPALTEEDTPIGKLLDDDPPSKVENGNQDMIVISIGSPAILTSTTLEAPLLAPDNCGMLNGVECNPGTTSSPTMKSVSFKWLYLLIQSLFFVIISLT